MSKKQVKLALFTSLILVSLNAAAHNNNNNLAASVKPVNVKHELRALKRVAPRINTKVLKLALTAYNNAYYDGIKDPKGLLTVINYSLPDGDKRLWTFNLKNNRLLINTWVAHGEGSGFIYATRFSNRAGTHESSLGLYITGKTFYGDMGYSMRLHGMSEGFNNNAYRRLIVMHGASYMKARYAREYGHEGESWGCLALTKRMAPRVINTIKGGTIIFAYANDPYWLHNSEFLHRA